MRGNTRQDSLSFSRIGKTFRRKRVLVPCGEAEVSLECIAAKSLERPPVNNPGRRTRLYRCNVCLCLAREQSGQLSESSWDQTTRTAAKRACEHKSLFSRRKPSKYRPLNRNCILFQTAQTLGPGRFQMFFWWRLEGDNESYGPNP